MVVNHIGELQREILPGQLLCRQDHCRTAGPVVQRLGGYAAVQQHRRFTVDGHTVAGADQFPGPFARKTQIHCHFVRGREFLFLLTQMGRHRGDHPGERPRRGMHRHTGRGIQLAVHSAHLVHPQETVLLNMGHQKAHFVHVSSSHQLFGSAGILHGNHIPQRGAAGQSAAGLSSSSIFFAMPPSSPDTPVQADNSSSSWRISSMVRMKRLLPVLSLVGQDGLCVKFM